jgi:hypothetical protein
MTEIFIRNCLIANEVSLMTQLAMEDGPPQKFC